jgi:hypothetical protein
MLVHAVEFPVSRWLCSTDSVTHVDTTTHVKSIAILLF